MTSAVVFAYHNVGVRCLAVLLARGIRVRLIVTHQDSPTENIWFDSVAALARHAGIPVITPADPHAPDVFARIRSLSPDFLFSFYYRHMLSAEMLAVAPRGAFNMHGSLLPKYRGRVPVNWAVLHGETQTGATLHEMVAKPDAGRIVDQLAVPILPNDTAGEVFGKVTVAAELVLHRALPALIEGSASLREQDLRAGSYFGGRKPEDGRIDWSQSSAAIHNLVRAVAPPYPGAYAQLRGRELNILRTWCDNASSSQGRSHGPVDSVPHSAALYVDGDTIKLRARDGGILTIVSATVDGHALTPMSFASSFGATRVALP